MEMEVETCSTLSSVLLVLILACVIMKFLNWVWFKPKKLEKMLRKRGLNGNHYRLLIGDLKDLAKVSRQEQSRSIQFSDHLPSHILPYNLQTQSKYGKNSFMWFGPRPAVNIAEPELVKEILNKHEIFHKLRSNPVVEMIIGGLLRLKEEKWAKWRKIINPTFHMEKLKNMVPAICLCRSNMTDEWDALVFSSNNKRSLELDVLPYLENLSGDIISRTALGSSYKEGKRVFELQKEQLKCLLEYISFSFIPGWSYIPTKANRRFKAICNEIRSVLWDVIDRGKKEMENGEKIQGDLLSMLLESNMREIDKGMSIEDIIEECKLFYFAGSETTSLLILWTMVMLSKHHEWQKRARQKSCKSSATNSPLSMVNMILLEVLRMYPPISYSGRTTTKTVKLGNITLPKGVDVMLLMGALHYDPEIWGQDVNEFKPERFSEGVSSAVKNHQFSYIPFSAGPRVCIGQNLAMIEAKVAMAMILQRFSFELGESYVHNPVLFITLRPQHGAPLLLQKLL